MEKLNYKGCTPIFDTYVKLQRKAVFEKEEDKKVQMIDTKHKHSYDVVDDGIIVMNGLNINESIQELGKISFLNHDIGRFLQARYVGDFQDNLLRPILRVNDHAELGVQVLDSGILKQEIPNVRKFDTTIKYIVKNHISGEVTDEDLSILATNVMQNEDLYDLFKNGDSKTKNQILNVLVQILQDIDRLDIYHQILDSRFVPNKTDEKVDSRIWDMFLKGQYININQLKEQGLWNANVGELVRLNFINQIRLLSVAKMIQDEDLITKVEEKRDNKSMKAAFDIARTRLDMMIKDSDGITVDSKKLKL